MVSLAEFLGDQSLVRGLGRGGDDPRREIKRGLEQAVARQTFLNYAGPAGEVASFYLLNTESDRRALEQLNRGRSPAPEGHGPPTVDGLPQDGLDKPAGPKPNIFALYEDNIGMLTPILAEELKEAEELYPVGWVGEAFQIAAAENRRRWGYISAILRRWVAEGKDDGKSGRYSKKDNRQKYLEDYQRRWGPSS